MKIYLAGPINNCTDEECHGWRDRAKELLLGHECIDPMVRDYRGQEATAYKAIVEDDKADIDSADMVLAMCPKPSVGTSMEILYAWERNKKIVAVVFGSVSPWLQYHSSIIVHSLPDALIWIGK